MQVAGGITLALCAVWLGTLGIRLTSPGIPAESDSTLGAAAATAVQGSGSAQLQVASSTYSY